MNPRWQQAILDIGWLATFDLCAIHVCVIDQVEDIYGRHRFHESRSSIDLFLEVINKYLYWHLV